VAVAIEEPEDLPAIFVDETQIILALGNLITNAYQAMPQGGKLTLSGSLQNKMIALTVQDNGTGIPPENMQRIFDPLFTTKAKHVGMGLPISKKLIEANGGRVVLESEAGKGSTFTMYLPVYKATQG
jgi:signal transduction histidine kinase